MISQYAVLAAIGFTLYGIGLGFYATPSTDAAMSSVAADEAGSAAGLYKMASSPGSAIGVAISATIYAAGARIPAHLVPHVFWGRRDHISLRFGGGIALLFSVFMCVIALISIMVGLPASQPDDERQAKPEIPAHPTFGS